MNRVVFAITSLVIIILIGSAFFLNAATSGIAGFMIWREFSSQAHDGQHTTVNGVDIYFETFGEGDPLLLLHGGMGTLESMHRQITAFSGSRHVIAPDSREHGRSGPIEGALHYSDMADDMIALLDQLEIESADVFGWSDGGIIALDLALRYPERVRRIAVFGTNFHYNGILDSDDDPFADGPDSEFAAPIRMLYRQTAREPDRWPVFFKKVTTMWEREPTYMVGDLSRIDATTLVMAGDNDVIKPAHLQELSESIPAAELIIISEADHFAPMNKPKDVNVILQEFFQ